MVAGFNYITNLEFARYILIFSCVALIFTQIILLDRWPVLIVIDFFSDYSLEFFFNFWC